MSKSKEVVQWKDRLAAEAKAVAKAERPSLSQISTRGGMLSYGGQPVQGNTLDAVVVGYVFENSWFKYAFDPNNPRNPDCYALALPDANGEVALMAPHPSIEEPNHHECVTCPMFQWGSDPKGGKGKACKEIRKLALLPVSALTDPDAIQKAEVAVLRLPVTSVRNWKRYVQEVSALHMRPPWATITTIAPKPHMKFQFEITFNTKGLVADEYLDALAARIGPVQEMLMQPYDKNAEPAPAAEGKDSKKY